MKLIRLPLMSFLVCIYQVRNGGIFHKLLPVLESHEP